ncbi:MAG TPA: AIR synthase-related protein [Thermomicrobiales bacterium]|nr:AIR synthase-related protein [Thermomicrobiales bacterium]
MASDDALIPPGKLPGHILERLLREYITLDPSVVVGPGIGRDAAAVRVGDRVIVVKTDPITFAKADAGRYLVHVNANDIACMGATPRWLLVTALLPERSTTAGLVEDIFRSIAVASRELNIALIGGHTEITLGLDRSILVGQMIGEIDEAGLLDISDAAPGDAILLCSAIAIEGTAILAMEARAALSRIDASIVERASRLLVEPGISVLPAARALRRSGLPLKGLHDPTEGGIATALAELSAASGIGVAVDLDAIPILPETRAICDELGLNPLGLIASGSLLAVLPAHYVDRAIDALAAAGIHAVSIGHMLDRGSASEALSRGTAGPMPAFPVDEIARFFTRA